MTIISTVDTMESRQHITMRKVTAHVVGEAHDDVHNSLIPLGNALVNVQREQ